MPKVSSAILSPLDIWCCVGDSASWVCLLHSLTKPCESSYCNIQNAWVKLLLPWPGWSSRTGPHSGRLTLVRPGCCICFIFQTRAIFIFFWIIMETFYQACMFRICYKKHDVLNFLLHFPLKLGQFSIKFTIFLLKQNYATSAPLMVVWKNCHKNLPASSLLFIFIFRTDFFGVYSPPRHLCCVTFVLDFTPFYIDWWNQIFEQVLRNKTSQALSSNANTTASTKAMHETYDKYD